MTWLAEHWIAVACFALYSGVLVWHGIEGARRSKTLEDYYVGGRSMSGLTIGLSFFATYVSTNTFVGLAGQSYHFGPWWLLFGAFFVSFSIISWLALADRLRQLTADLGSVTIADFIGLRYESRAARTIGAAIIVIASLLYMTAIYKGIGGALEAFLGLSYETAVLLVLIVTMVYTAAGGFVSVVKTDVVQGVIVLVAAAIMFGFAAYAAGGVSAPLRLRDLPDGERLFTLGGPIPTAVMFGIFVSGAIKLLVDPRQLSRFYGLADRGSIRTGLWVSTLAFGFTFGLLLPLGLYARVILPGAPLTDTDDVVPALLASGIYPEPLSSLLLVGMVAAAMSSLDSVLLVTATSFQRDLLPLGIAPPADERRAIRYTQACIVVFACVTAALAWNPPAGIVKLTTWSGSLFAACFLPAILFALYGRRGSGKAVVASYFAGFAVLVAWSRSDLAGTLHEVFPATVASIAAFWLVARSAPDGRVSGREPSAARSS
jgi:SSS family transporter